MHILIVNRMTGTLLGGGETFDLAIARNLVKTGHNVTVVTAKPLFSRPLVSYSDLEIVYLSTPNLRPLEARVRQVSQTSGAICRYVDMFIFERIVLSWLLHNRNYSQYDLVQCCGMFWLPRWVITRFNIPVVSWLPGPPSKLTQRLIRALVSYPHFGLFTHGDTVMFLEDELGFARGVEFEVIEPGVDLATAEACDAQRNIIRDKLNISDDTVVGVTVARLIPIKNIAFLIEGLKRAVHELGAPIVWLMVGEGPERPSLERLAKAKGLEGCVRWLGQLQQSEVHRILAAADIFALTSAYENFSIATLEAMAHGLPIVATDVGYLKTIVLESGGGILVSPGDVEGLAQAIARLATDSDFRRRLGNNGRAYVQCFDWSNTTTKLLKLYEQVMAGRPVRCSRLSGDSRTPPLRSQRGD